MIKHNHNTKICLERLDVSRASLVVIIWASLVVIVRTPANTLNKDEYGEKSVKKAIYYTGLK